tara:strand:+ start:94 stop:534 length:441 start_codon:yes stop_codon:yes gene_type:complete
MSTEVWIVIGVVIVVVWGTIIWELMNSPVYPIDYKNVEEEAETRDAPPTNEKSPPKSQTYSDPHNPQYKHWTYATTDCPCQMGKPVKKHTSDCAWIWNNHGKYYQLSELEKQLDQLKNYSDIAFDPAGQKEYLRLEAEIKLLKDRV